MKNPVPKQRLEADPVPFCPARISRPGLNAKRGQSGHVVHTTETGHTRQTCPRAAMAV
ncbi:hypothetical protein [Polaromonas sp. CG9_12]|nr:hypothetical protein [Polaromonas sp. CG9_12]